MPKDLPMQSTPFVGREMELAHIAQVLADPACKFLTLTGPPGIGKTRLATQAAPLAAGPQAGQVVFVSLASIVSPHLLLAAIAGALGLAFHGDDPAGELLAYLKDQELLLVLDHCDHVAGQAQFVSALLAAAPRVKLLATSRQQLGLPGEQTYAVEGLAYAEDEAVVADTLPAALQLFVERAQHVDAMFQPRQQDFAAVAHICRLLAGLPLAIELAAGWVRQLSCQDILSAVRRVSTAPLVDGAQPDHESRLRGVIESSWRLLSEEERNVLRKLVVFRGGFRREAAPRASGASLPLLASLVNLSLLQLNQSGRYELHESVRSYVQLRLNRHPEEQEKVQHLHSGYFVDFLQYREPQLRGPQQHEALAEITEEIENVRVAWRWAVEMGSEGEIGKSLEALGRFYEMLGWWREGEESFALAADVLGGRARGSADPAILAKLLLHQARFAERRGNRDELQRLCQQALPLLESGAADLRRAGRRTALAATLSALGWARLRLAQAEAVHALQESLQLSQDAGERWSSAATLALLAEQAQASGDTLEARRLYDEAAPLFDAAGDRWSKAEVLLRLAALAKQEDNAQEARRLHDEGAALYRELGLVRPLQVG